MDLPRLLLIPLMAAAQIPQPPGKSFDIGGLKLHLNCTGTGSPAVILEAGFPGSSLDWAQVQPEVSRFTRVCSYDRAGLGWSDPGQAPRTSSRIAGELHKLLTVAAVPGPYVLVGHSFGGLHVREFTRQFPQAVIGMVLVDATHEDQWDFEPRRDWAPTGKPAKRLPKQPAAIDPITKQLQATGRWKTAERAEREAMAATIANAKRQPKRLPAIPLLVLSAGEAAGWADSVPAAIVKDQQLQREMAAFSPLGKWIPVPGANHYIQISNPATVTSAIRQVVEASRDLRLARP
jgi:pimeloyl-ACP methyl ester carboxylesterase